VGDVLTLIASVGYALYQVLYKKYAALPSDPELASETAYAQVPSGDELYGMRDDLETGDAVYPPPFGLHPNMLTSIVGFFTLTLLWVPIPILHYLGVERFVLPPTSGVTFAIAGIALSGVLFNAGFMVRHLPFDVQRNS
jgi:drug/metabolite transporter (DMT)-like permease